jgi:hypothetical protein
MENKIIFKTLTNKNKKFLTGQFIKLNKYIKTNPKYIKLYKTFNENKTKCNYDKLILYLNCHINIYMKFLQCCEKDFPYIINISFATNNNKVFFTDKENSSTFKKYINNEINLLNIIEYKSMIQVNNKENGLIITDDFLSLGNNSLNTTIFSANGFIEYNFASLGSIAHGNIASDIQGNIYYTLMSTPNIIYMLINNNGDTINNSTANNQYTYKFTIINSNLPVICGSYSLFTSSNNGNIGGFWCIVKRKILNYAVYSNNGTISLKSNDDLTLNYVGTGLPELIYDNGTYLYVSVFPVPTSIFFYSSLKTPTPIIHAIGITLSFTSSTQNNITYTYSLIDGGYLNLISKNTLHKNDIITYDINCIYTLDNFARSTIHSLASCGDNSLNLIYTSSIDFINFITIILYWTINSDGSINDTPSSLILNQDSPEITLITTYPNIKNYVPNLYSTNQSISNIGLLSP